MKAAVVTGAGTGIGRAASLALAEGGYSVILAGRRPQPLQSVADAIAGMGGRAIPVAADVASETSVDALFARVAAEFGRLDLLFNNAGISGPARPLEQVSPAEWREVIEVNLTGVFLCTRAAVQLMKAQSPRGGRIINNGSIASHVPRPHSCAYAASKHAISGLTRATALEGREFSIACGQLDIGNAASEMGAQVSAGALQANGSRIVEPTIELRHVAEAVRYMAGLPLDANVLTMTVMATGMPYVGRG
jgi:NAD(P)-dependent dehydrogenase (short-subunit alcohol dehydrogenase family)